MIHIHFTSIINMLMVNTEGEIKQWTLGYPLHLTGEDICTCDTQSTVLKPLNILNKTCYYFAV